MRLTWLKKNYTPFKKFPDLRFLLDMGIAQSVSVWLKGLGHDALHLNDEGLFKLADNYILEKAAEESRIILTTDMDFGQLLAFNQNLLAPVIQFRTSTFTPSNIREKLELFFERFPSQPDEMFIITFDDNRMRYRKLPLK